MFLLASLSMKSLELRSVLTLQVGTRQRFTCFCCDFVLAWPPCVLPVLFGTSAQKVNIAVLVVVFFFHSFAHFFHVVV